MSLRTRFRIGLAALVLGWPCVTARADQKAERELTERLDRAHRDLADVERQLELVKRMVPPAFDRAQEEEGLKRMARRAELAAIEIRPVAGPAALELEGGGPSGVEIHRLDVSGTDLYEKVHVFLSVLGHFPRLIDLETLHLQAGPKDAVTFAIRLGLPVLGAAPVPVAPPAGAPAGPPRSDASAGREAVLSAYEAAREAAVRARLAEVNGRADATRARVRALAGLADRRRHRLGHGLGLFAREAEDQAVALSEVHFDATATFKGVVLGASARRGLEPALEKAGFQVTSMEVSPAGRCQSFVATTRYQADDPPFEAVLRNGLFDAGARAVCSPDRPASLGHVKARGAGGPGALTVRLRAVDVGDVFRVLSGLGSQAFAVDADVKGTLGLEVEAATLDELLAALGSVGLTVGPGPLRRVSLADSRMPTSAAVTFSGNPVSLSFKNADLVDVLRVFHDISGLPILIPRGLRGTVTIFASELPWDQVLEAVITSAGLAYVIEDSRVFVGPEAAVRAAGRPGFVDVAGPPTADAGDPLRHYRRPWSSHPDRLNKLAVDDLEVVGLGRAGEGWTAYALGPSGQLWVLEAGQALTGGSVRSVGPAGVTFETGGRPLEVPFRP